MVRKRMQSDASSLKSLSPLFRSPNSKSNPIRFLQMYRYQKSFSTAPFGGLIANRTC